MGGAVLGTKRCEAVEAPPREWNANFARSRRKAFLNESPGGEGLCISQLAETQFPKSGRGHVGT
jgi:hypothetical protein